MAAVCGRYQAKVSSHVCGIISTGQIMPQRNKEKKRLTTPSRIASVETLQSAEKKNPLQRPVKP